MSEEWGPWIEHDGKGCPCVGMYVHVIGENREEAFGLAGSEGAGSWDWSKAPRYTRLTHYRIRKPRALQQLRDMIAGLPTPTPAKEGA